MVSKNLGHRKRIGNLKVYNNIAKDWYGKRYDNLSMEQKKDIVNFVRAGRSKQ